MSPRFSRLCLLAATAALTAWAQTTPPAPASTAARIPPTRSATKSTKPSKTGVPDPDLLDGSAFEKEKRPMEGMLSEIEIGEKEGPKGAKISPDSGPGGGQSSEKPDSTQAAGGGAQSATDAAAAGASGAPPSGEQSQAGGGSPPPPGGAQAEASGTQVANLQVPEGAQAAGGAQNKTPRNQQIGDATAQIPTMDKESKDVVGVEASTAQQYEKALPKGGQQSGGGNRNQGVEKGRVVPKGL